MSITYTTLVTLAAATLLASPSARAQEAPTQGAGAPLPAVQQAAHPGRTAATDAALELDVALLIAHYDATLEDLVTHAPAGLTPAQREARARIVGELTAYRDRGGFVVQSDFPDERIPHFRYPDGKLCAVGNLIEVCGEDELLARLVAQHNNAYPAELSADAEFQGWIESVGLTLNEVGRIHGSLVPQVLPAPTPYAGPGDSLPGPRSSVPTAPGPAPTTPGSSSPASSPGTASSMRLSGIGPQIPRPIQTPLSGTLSGQSLPMWWTWWEFNKRAWLPINRITEVEQGHSSSSGLQQARAAASELFLAARDDSNAAVRRAALIALARVQGPAAAMTIREHVSDAAYEVRFESLLALGATGSERAVHALMTVAHTGSLDGKERLGSVGRSAAVLALGLARQVGSAHGVDRMLPARSSPERSADRNSVDQARLLHNRLASSPDLVRVAREIGQLAEKKRDRVDESPTWIRALALEALRHDSSADALSILLRALGDRSLDVRRSAALTLGALGDELAIAPLQTTFDLESDKLMRGFLLIAQGQIGGADAQRFLIKQLERGKSDMRPWAALGLGILAREANDPEARDALLEYTRHETNEERRCAGLLALGIADDDRVAGIADRLLKESKTSQTRRCAGLSLCLIRHPGARGSLREAIVVEKNPTVRAVLAQCLAYLGDTRDTEFLVGELADVNQPELQMQIAAALAYLGTIEAVEPLSQLFADSKTSDLGRGAALQALGMLLAREQPFALTDIAWDSNYTVLPDWMLSALMTTL